MSDDSTCCCRDVCPEVVPLTQNITVLDLAAGEATLTSEIFTYTDIVSVDPTGLSITLAETPIAGMKVQLAKNGTLQREGTGLDWTITGAVITLADAAQVGDVFEVYYGYEA